MAHGIVECSADCISFKVLSKFIASDKNYIYYCGKCETSVSRATFYLDKDIPKDKNYAYFCSYDSLFPIRNADARTFRYLDVDTLCHRWAKDKNQYFFRKETKFISLKVDYNTFKFLNANFLCDKDSVYLSKDYDFPFGIAATGDKLRIIGNKYVILGDTIYYYANNIEIENKFELRKTVIKNISEIRIINDWVICVNNKLIYYGHIFKSPELDSKSFETFSKVDVSKFAKNKNHVYYEERIINGADPKTFTPLDLGSENFSKDKNHVFYGCDILENVDPKTFRNEKNKHYYVDDRGNRFNWSGKKLQ